MRGRKKREMGREIRKMMKDEWKEKEKQEG